MTLRRTVGGSRRRGRRASWLESARVLCETPEIVGGVRYYTSLRQLRVDGFRVTSAEYELAVAMLGPRFDRESYKTLARANRDFARGMGARMLRGGAS